METLSNSLRGRARDHPPISARCVSWLPHTDRNHSPALAAASGRIVWPIVSMPAFRQQSGGACERTGPRQEFKHGESQRAAGEPGQMQKRQERTVTCLNTDHDTVTPRPVGRTASSSISARPLLIGGPASSGWLWLAGAGCLQPGPPSLNDHNV
jgi:hypothetical protein